MTYKEAEEKIKQIVDADFLTKLTEVAKLTGWTCDYFEIRQFIENLHQIKDIQCPDLTEYEIEE